MNVYQNRFTNLKRLAIAIVFTGITFFLSTQSTFAQNFVNADQAGPILKQALLDLQDKGFTAYNNSNYTEAYDLGYQYRYVQRMLELLDSGSSVEAAVENGLPSIPFNLGNLETGERISDPNLNARRDDLRQYAASLLVL